MRYKRSEGLTASEQVLAELCDQSFLKLWTYPNLFRKPSKELTDLLVVFGNDVLIFSDKSCKYPNTGDVELDWSRWYNKSIAYSARQIAQAERWIRSYPDEVFLDARCLEKLPVTLPSSADMRVHRICVPLGALDRAELETGTRWLKIDQAVLNDEARFTVGRTDKARGWVHVFDEASLHTVLSELSTIKDFIHYLESKVAVLSTDNFKFAEAETDMLAYYLWHGRTFPPIEREYRIDGRLWPQVDASSQYRSSREANKVSQLWDGFIERVNDEYIEENLDFGNENAMSEHERAARILASETRFYRRVLSKAILERAERAKKEAISALLPSESGDVSYVLFVGRGDQGGDHVTYRKDRLEQLRGRCVAAKAIYPERRFIVGIGMDALGVEGSSEDFICIDTECWTNEDVTNAQKIRTELGYFKDGNAVVSRLSEDEYPGRPGAIDVASLADELSRLTVAESLELAEILRSRWQPKSGPESAGQ
ncbi:hypothetical protein [Bradyrhizobium sp. LB11.1]|uniref:hypothetical protein n=1 Tax=Bradyrhizobium sp. LB11.1 TaxID=3156326 RepID=UPI0033933452